MKKYEGRPSAGVLRLGAALALAVELASAGCQRGPSELPPGAVLSTGTPAAASGAPSGLRGGPIDPHAGMDPRGANTGASANADPHAGLDLGAHAGANASAGAAAAPSARALPLQWTTPEGWVSTPPASPMRAAQYRVPRASGDAADAELVVITFGPGQGGSTESNLERWWGQVQQADGRASRELAERREFDANGLHVTFTAVSGSLGGGAMPGMPAAPSVERGRLAGAIVDTPSGPWYFKLTGPEATVRAAQPAFEQLLRSVRAAP